MGKYERFENGVLVETVDDRTVQTTAAERVTMMNAWMEEQLQPTDYIIIKASDPTSGAAVPQAVLDARVAVRNAGRTAKDAIAAIVAAAQGDDDKEACDAIERVGW